jgi:hypothetical protein
VHVLWLHVLWLQRLWRGRLSSVCLSSIGNMDSRLAPPAGSGPEAVRITGVSVGASVTRFGPEFYVSGITVGGCLHLSVTCPRQLIGPDKGERFMRQLVMYLIEQPCQLSTDREVSEKEAVVGQGLLLVQ